MPDLFFYRSQKDIEEQEKVEAKKDEDLAMPVEQGEDYVQAEVVDFEQPNWEEKQVDGNQDWATEGQAQDWATEGQAATGW